MKDKDEQLLLERSATLDLEPALSLLDDDMYKGRVVVSLSSDVLDDADLFHGTQLMEAFLKALLDKSIMPQTILLYGKAVVLLKDDNPMKVYFEKLAGHHVDIKACKESLELYIEGRTPPCAASVPMQQITKDMFSADFLVCP